MKWIVLFAMLPFQSWANDSYLEQIQQSWNNVVEYFTAKSTNGTWYLYDQVYKINRGPYTQEELSILIENKIIGAESYLAKSGDNKWVLAKDLFPESISASGSVLSDPSTTDLMFDYLKFVQKWAPRSRELSKDMIAFTNSLPKDLSPEQKVKAIDQWLLSQENVPEYEEFPHVQLAMRIADMKAEMNHEELDAFHDETAKRIDKLAKIPLIGRFLRQAIDDLHSISAFSRHRDHVLLELTDGDPNAEYKYFGK